MIKKYADDYGFKNIQFLGEEGGSFTICDYDRNAEGERDLGMIHVMSPSGMGFSERIIDVNDIDSKIRMVNKVVWLSKEDKEQFKIFLNEMKGGE